MARKGKKYIEAARNIDAENVYKLQDACKLVSENAKAKFDETVDIAVRLGVDPRKADQNVRGSVPLPHGLGKTVRVAVFAKGDKAKEAEAAGADIVGAEDLVESVQNGKIDFDTLIATPDMMPQVGKVGKILGPRGLMPSPKVGTVTTDVAAAVKRVKSGVAEYKVDKEGAVHAPVGKASFGADKLKENVAAVFGALQKAKPQSSKGVYLKSASISSTMGPGVKFDVADFR